MTQTGYSNAIVNVMLGWLKGLANWVLKLFNLAGSGGNPLLWLSENWLKLLVLLLVVGLVVDWLVWMIRWRPYWVWFRKKRIIVNDERFLAGEEYEDLDSDDEDDFERQYVVPSTVVPRTAARKPAVTSRRAPSGAKAKTPQRRRTNAVVPVRREQQRVQKRPVKAVRPQQEAFPDDLFEVDRDREDYSDFYEDEVFNVSNLPDAQDYDRNGRRKRR